MFGKNKISQDEIEKLKKIVEIDEHFFEKMQGGKDMFDATLTECEESYRQVDADVSQVQENIRSASELAGENVEITSALCGKIAECRQEAEKADEKQAVVISDMHKMFDGLAELVDDNKHFTAPSKFLSEFPAVLKAQNEETAEELEQMEEYGKQMGVLALNAAIEAGRMGEAGKQFVTAAESIRTYASNYDEAIETARQKLKESNDRIAELEEQVHRMVTLLKDNNVSTAKLLKSGGEMVRNADDSVNSAVSEQLLEIGNQLTAVRNSDEEIIKSEERNRMQMEDLAAEFDTQRAKQKEIQRNIDPLYRHIVERKAGQ